MEFNWKITARDQRLYRDFIASQFGKPSVQDRIKLNVDRIGVEISEEKFWRGYILSLLTTRQNSGPNSLISKFIKSDTELNNLEFCKSHKNIEAFAAAKLKAASLQYYNKIAKSIDHGITKLRRNEWENIEKMLRQLMGYSNKDTERSVAKYLQGEFKGLGPKQSRNLIQGMGLTRYEIPIDSRVVAVLKKLNFPVPISAKTLADEDYYCFIEDGIHRLLQKISVVPCIFDACAFVSEEKNTEQVASNVWANDVNLS